jgi:hypothetical protein
MHPFDCLLDGKVVIDTVGLVEKFGDVHALWVRLSLSFLLDEGNEVAVVAITYANENGVTLTGDEDILFVVDDDSVFGENGDFPVLAILPTLMKEVGKSSNESAVEALVKRWRNEVE